MLGRDLEPTWLHYCRVVFFLLTTFCFWLPAVKWQKILLVAYRLVSINVFKIFTTFLLHIHTVKNNVKITLPFSYFYYTYIFLLSLFLLVLLFSFLFFFFVSFCCRNSQVVSNSMTSNSMNTNTMSSKSVIAVRIAVNRIRHAAIWVDTGDRNVRTVTRLSIYSVHFVLMWHDVRIHWKNTYKLI